MYRSAPQSGNTFAESDGGRCSQCPGGTAATADHVACEEHGIGNNVADRHTFFDLLRQSASSAISSTSAGHLSADDASQKIRNSRKKSIDDSAASSTEVETSRVAAVARVTFAASRSETERLLGRDSIDFTFDDNRESYLRLMQRDLSQVLDHPELLVSAVRPWILQSRRQLAEADVLELDVKFSSPLAATESAIERLHLLVGDNSSILWTEDVLTSSIDPSIPIVHGLACGKLMALSMSWPCM